MIARDFSEPAAYIVMAEDGTTAAYTVTVTHASEIAALKTITSFIFKAANNPTLSSDVTGSISASTISGTVPYGTDISALVPSIVHTGKSIVPVNESARSFYSPQNYTVTAGDDTTADYSVTVNISNPPGAVTVMKSGQTTSYADYDDGYYEIGLEWPSPRFTDNTDGTVSDNLTGLMWEWSTNDTLRNWQTALDYCNDSTASGYGDWRMPNINELETLINYEEVSPAGWLNLLAFDDCKAQPYWSSTTDIDDSTSAYSVNMSDARIYRIVKTNSNYVLAVRGISSSIPATGVTESQATGDDGDLEMGVAWPSPRFTDNGNNTITDNLTGLMWEQAPADDTENWANALIEATTVINYGSYNDWRVPNVRELRSLFSNYAETHQATWLQDEGFNTPFPTATFFTSTTLAASTEIAFFIWTSDQEVGTAGKTGGYRLIYVRGGN